MNVKNIPVGCRITLRLSEIKKKINKSRFFSIFGFRILLHKAKKAKKTSQNKGFGFTG
jgi:hypothetical protein